MASSVPVFGADYSPKFNAAGGTAYYGLIPPNLNGFTRVLGLDYTCGNTANVITFMRPIGRAKLTQAQTTSDSTVTTDVDPSPTGNTLAAGDQVVLWPCVDGTARRAQVSSFNSTTKVITLTGTLAANVNTSTKLFNLGVSGDTDPATGLGFPTFIPTVSTTAPKEFIGGGPKTNAKGDPMLLYCPNATAATDINGAAFAYSAN